MMRETQVDPSKGWGLIERERRLDRWVQRICGAAWFVTLALALFYGILVAGQIRNAIERQRVGAGGSDAVVAAAVPLVVALGILALLVAALSTVGVFLRFRTAALGEIQLRLAALEAMLATEGERKGQAQPKGPA